MYEPKTILKLKKTRGTENKPFPYDRVEVVGQSPVNHGAQASEWVGAAGQGVVITPLDGFGSTLDEPYGKLQSIYDVESLPPDEIIAAPVKVIRSNSGSAGPSPEEVFAGEAGQGKVQKRPPARSPLDNADTEAAAKAEALRTGVTSPLDEE